MSFILRVLGGAALEGSAGPVQGRAAHRRRIALLSILASARGRGVPRERLVGLLWPDSSPQASRHTLSEALSVLRRELGPDVFLTVGDEVALNAEVVTSDLEEFRSALDVGDPERAVPLYCGPFLDGFTVAEAPEFERWAEEERDRTGRAYAAAVELVAKRYEAEGDARNAAEWWRLLAAHDPYSSRVALELMRALDAAGERAAALRHASLHVGLLRATLEVEPAPELIAYVEQLKREPPARTAPAPPLQLPGNAAPAPPAEPSHPAPSLPKDPVTLVGDPADRPVHRDATIIPRADAPTTRRAVILCAAVAEVAGSRGGGAVADRVRQTFHEEARREIERGGGELVDFLGDGVLAEFAAPVPAARTALRLFRRFGRRGRVGGTPYTLHAALHLGEVSTTADGGYYGEAVSAATRLQEEAAEGTILVTEDVRAEVRTLPGIRLHRIGARTLPGHAAPSAIYELSDGRRAGRIPRAAAEHARPALASHLDRRVAWAVIALATILVLGAVAARIPGRQDTGGTPRLAPNRIAVVPFELLSPDTAVRYLAAGLTDQVMLQLSGVQALEVVSALGVRQAMGSGVSPDSLGRTLGAGTLLEAMVERGSDSVRVVVRIVDGATGTIIGSEAVQRPQGRPLALEGEVGRAVARLVRRRLGPEAEIREVEEGTLDDAARTLYLRARQAQEDAESLFGARDASDVSSAWLALARADTLFARAAERDPRWLVPVLGRGWVALARAAREPGVAGEAQMGEALRFAEHVLQRTPDNAEALELRGAVRFRRALSAATEAGAAREADAAEDDFRRAATAGALSRLSQLLRTRARYAESLIEARRAHELDAYLVTEAELLDREIRAEFLQEQYGAAQARCRAARAEYPADPRFLQCELNLLARDPGAPADTARAREVMEKLDAAESVGAARAAGRLYSPLFRQMMYAVLLARAGDADSARAVVVRARAQASADSATAVYLLYDDAWVSHRLGDTLHARASLDRHLRLQPYQIWQVRRDPVFRGWALPAEKAATRAGTRG